jgi:hypothetical protein
MANSLSPAEWKKVLKDFKDAPETGEVTKAIDAYAKAEPKAKEEPQPVLDALEKVVEAAKDAKAANFKDKKRKPLVDFLDDVVKDAAAMKVKAERMLQEKKESGGKGGDDDEGNASEMARLKERLLKVKKLESVDAMPFVLALGGKSHGLVIAKTPALSNDHKKRARAMRVGNGQLHVGRVFGEGGMYIFEMATKPPGGLAKAIKKAALMHADLPIRLKLRGPDGFEVDDENDVDEVTDLGTDSGDDDEVGVGDAEPSANGPQTGAAEKQTAESVAEKQAAEPVAEKQTAEPEAEVSTPQSDWEKSHREIEPDYLQAVEKLRGLPQQADALRTIMKFATGQAEAGQFPKAQAALNRLRNEVKQALLTIKSLEEWNSAVAGVVVQIRAVEKSVVATRDPAAKEVLVALEAIAKSLSLRPDTKENIEKLKSFLKTDDVTAAEEAPPRLGTLKIREPLAKILEKLPA